MTTTTPASAITLSADFESHRIVGFVHADYVEIPLLTHVWTHETGGELWTGGCRDAAVLPADFDLVVSLYTLERYVVGEDTTFEQVEAFDAMGQDVQLFKDWAGVVAMYVENGRKVLVHCQAGLNRSGLVSALALRELGFDGAAAVALLRERRSHMVLCNSEFEAFALA